MVQAKQRPTIPRHLNKCESVTSKIRGDNGLTVGIKFYTTYIEPVVLTVVDQAWNLVAPVYVGRNISHGVDAVLVL